MNSFAATNKKRFFSLEVKLNRNLNGSENIPLNIRELFDLLKTNFGKANQNAF